MKIDTEIILPHIYVLTFDTQYEACMSFVRMQEFYESPKFKGKYFTLEEFIDYWAINWGDGYFDYVSRWHGFNLPGNVIEAWKDIFWLRDNGSFREREVSVLNNIQKAMKKEKLVGSKYYVIGVHKESSSASRQEVIEHELAHAFYYLYPEYKRVARKMLKEIPKKTFRKAKKALLDLGYGTNVLEDEMQAYFSTYKYEAGDNKDLRHFRIRKEFVETLSKYRQKLVKKPVSKK